MKDVILKIIYLCVDEINDDLETDGKLEKNELEEIFSANSKLDSMGLVNFVVSIEEKIQEHFNLDVTLADDKAMSQSRSPFRTIGSLAEYIENIVNKA